MVSPGGTEDAQVPYAEFSRIRQTPGLILLFTDEKKMILLDPERFEKETEADFWRLMNEKCPRAVPKAKRTL
ncbi:MAG: YcxB family protein [Oscillospiraceae bacterium]|nr:YcxB family protein [Oscillospiraceae bacterium]